MRSWTRRLAGGLVAISLLSPAAAFASKKYQVTGKVLEVTDKVIVVMKDTEKFEIDRSADTKVEGELKVGEKVTVFYHMTADTVEVKKEK
jgi:hypothetical protein